MPKNIRIVALVSFIEGVIALLWLASIPASGGIFSPVRLVLLFGILLVSLACLIGFIYIKSENHFTQKISQIAGGKLGLPVSWLLTTLSLAVWVLILYKGLLLTFIDEVVYARLLPIAMFGILLGLQLGILFLIPNIQKGAWKNLFSPFWKPTIIILGCFIIVWVLMSVTHLGFVFDNVGLSWGPPGTPISFPQINLVFAVSASLIFAFHILQLHISLSSPVRDILISIGLWGIAVILWWNTPVGETHFNPPPMAPNYETYPNSDALIFDKSAYHLLHGIGFSNQLHRRPLYVGMLALFHKLGGSGYENTIFLQILMLAFIPSLTYLLTSKLSNRLAGVIAGGLILLREKNAIELSDKIITSNAKLMMSDMVALLGVITFVYVMAKVFMKKNNNTWLLGIAGACLGLIALVRAQVLILVPLVLIFILLNNRPLKLGIKNSTIFLLGLVLVMLPWVWRNWSLTGTFVLDDQGEERLLARNYSSNPIALPSPLPNESQQEFSLRIKKDALTFMIEHPSDVAFFVSNHFLRNMATSTIYIAPFLSTRSMRDMIDSSLFWESWQGRLNGNSSISIFITLVFVAFGISIAQTKNKYAGWFPITVFLVYSAGNALVRSSGWRFSLPVDWAILVYYSIALAYLPSKIKLGEDLSSQTNLAPASTSNKLFSGWTIFLILLLMGASVPIAEYLIPASDLGNITGNTIDNLINENIVTQSDVDVFLEQDNAAFYSGIALYPRYIVPRSRVYLAITSPKELRYLHFWLVNDGDNQIVFPTDNPPDVFPHTGIVSILGCKQDNYILAQVVILHSTPEQIFTRNVPAELNCSLESSN